VSPSDELRRILRARSLPAERDPVAAFIAARLVQAGGRSVLAVLFFGSHKTGASPSSESAHDLFIVVSNYHEFYGSLRRAGLSPLNPVPASILNAFLPPNLMAVAFEREGRRSLAKCAVVTLRIFERETKGKRRDHFLAARLFQSCEISFSRGPLVENLVIEALAGAALKTCEWAGPWLPATFGLEDYIRTLFRVSLEAEIKPEGPERGEALYLAQRAALDPVYEQVLSDGADRGKVRLLGRDRYRLERRTTSGERRKASLFFRRSKIRATARWLKYIWTFDGWLDYAVRKLERRSGEKVFLSARERRWPLVFLWPRIIRMVRAFRRRRPWTGNPGGRPCAS
jgi:hypothetical protein